MSKALQHLEDAETALLSFISAISSAPEDADIDDLPDAVPVLLAVMRSIARAAGIIEAGVADE